MESFQRHSKTVETQKNPNKSLLTECLMDERNIAAKIMKGSSILNKNWKNNIDYSCQIMIRMQELGDAHDAERMDTEL